MSNQGYSNRIQPDAEKIHDSNAYFLLIYRKLKKNTLVGTIEEYIKFVCPEGTILKFK